MTIRMLRSRAAKNPGESQNTTLPTDANSITFPTQTNRRASYRDALLSRPTSPVHSEGGGQAPSNGDQLVNTTSNKIRATSPLSELSQPPESLQDWVDDNLNPWISRSGLGIAEHAALIP